MKKKILGGLAVLAIAVVAAFNVNVNTQENGLSNISLDNVEALASEGGPATKYYLTHCGSKSGTRCQSTLTGPSCSSTTYCP